MKKILNQGLKLVFALILSLSCFIIPTHAQTPTISYRTHVQNVGWQNYLNDGATAGTTGQSLRLEGIQLKLNDTSQGHITYRTHIQNIGWQGWKSDNTMSGTSGQSLRLEAIQIKLTGELAEHYDIAYRVHAQNFGWLDWALNGQSSGTAGYGYRLEAIQVKLVEKGTLAQIGTHYHTKNLMYKTHVQTIGWQGYCYDGGMSGTSGRALRLEGICIKLNDLMNVNDTDLSNSGIQYRTHVQNIGWQDWKSNDVMSGTSGKSLRLEAIEIKLTGDIAQYYNVEYRTHVQNIGWQDWKSNGQTAGTSGKGLRLEGIEIKLTKKTTIPPKDETIICNHSWKNIYKTVTITEAYDEQKLVKKAYDEQVLVKEAYDETTYAKRYVCGKCGQQFTKDQIDELVMHCLECGGTGSHYSVKKVPIVTHHDAVTKVVHHEDEYETIHHNAITEQQLDYSVCEKCGETK